MALTPTEEAQVRAIIPAFTNGKTISAMTSATDINETESIEISQDGTSKKSTLGLALSNRLKYSFLQDQTVLNVDELLSVGKYVIGMNIGEQVNGETAFGLDVYQEENGVTVQMQMTTSDKIYSRHAPDGALSWTPWMLIGANQALKENVSNKKSVINDSVTDYPNCKAVGDADAALSTRIDNLIIESGTSDAEVIDARGGYPLLNNRLDSEIIKNQDTAPQTASFNIGGSGKAMTLYAKAHGLSIANATDPTNQMVFDGDSLTVGYGGSLPWTDDVVLPVGWNASNTAVGGRMIIEMAEHAVANVDTIFNPMAKLNVLWIQGGTNDEDDPIYVGGNSTAIFARLVAYCRERRRAGWKIIVSTLPSRAGVAPYGDTFKNEYNALIRANWPYFADALADLSLYPNIGDDGAYTNLTYFLPDGYHLTNAGYAYFSTEATIALNYLIANLNTSRANKINVGRIGEGTGDININDAANPSIQLYNDNYSSFIAAPARGGTSDLALGAGATEAMRILGDSLYTGLGTPNPKSKLDVNGGVRVADDTDTASVDKVGTVRYRQSANNSYCEMCMKTGAATYAWIAISTQSW